MAGKEALARANRAKMDEFYTQLADVEAELRHYREHFRGKVVLCNCDDPYESNFFKYFAMNFNHLGLKKLITTSLPPWLGRMEQSWRQGVFDSEVPKLDNRLTLYPKVLYSPSVP